MPQSEHSFGPRSTIAVAVVFAGVASFALGNAAQAQMSVGSTVGVLPPAVPTSSLILGDDLADFQAAWASPVSTQQAAWKADVQARANQSPSGTVPASFGTATNDSSIAQAAGLRFALSGSATDLNKAVSALSNAAIPVVNFDSFITRTEVLSSYLAAYDFIRGASPAALPQATRDAIEARLLGLTQSLTYGNNTDSNARMKIGATAALAGVILRDQDQLNRGLQDIQRNLDYSTTDDGWYADGPGHYLNYTLKQLGYFVRAYEQGSGVDLYPNFRPFVEMSVGLRKPDGTSPNVADSLNSPVAVHFFTQDDDPAASGEALWYLDHLAPPPHDFSTTNVVNNDFYNTVNFALTDMIDNVAHEPDRSPTFISEGGSHVTVFRQDWGPTSDYLLLSPGVNPPSLLLDFEPPIDDVRVTAFHSQNDTAEILVSSEGKYILVAPGYNRTDLTNSPPGFDPDNPTWHNVLLVDGNLGPLDLGKAMRPEDFTHTNRLDSRELGGYHGVSDFASLSMNYNNVEVTRSVAFANEDYFVVADRMDGDASHQYGFNLIGLGTKTNLLNTTSMKQVRWVYDGVMAIETLVSSHSMTLGGGTLAMHDTWDEFETTQRMRANMNATDGLYLSVIESGPDGPAHLAVTKLSSDPAWLAVSVAHDTAGWTDYVLSQHAPALRTAGPLTSDAVYAYLREDAGELTSLMMAQGASFDYAGSPLLLASDPLTLSLLLLEGEIRGTVSDDGLVPGTELSIFGQGPIGWATLDGEFLSLSNGLDFGSIFLPHGGELVISFTAVPEPSACLLAFIGAVAVACIIRRKGERKA